MHQMCGHTKVDVMISVGELLVTLRACSEVIRCEGLTDLTSPYDQHLVVVQPTPYRRAFLRFARMGVPLRFSSGDRVSCPDREWPI